MSTAPPPGTPSARRAPAGIAPGGEVIEAIVLDNGRGIGARILSLGAALQSLVAPDREGKRADLLLGYDEAAAYAENPAYFGVTVGRYANRIAGGRFTLDGQTFQLPLNDGRNTLHGGDRGFDRALWRIVAIGDAPEASVTLAHSSADGDGGFPGRLDAQVTYTLDAQGALTIAFGASTSAPTIVNLTNHAYWNLAGEGAPDGVLDHRLTIPAKAYAPVDASLIPTGELRAVAGTPFDFGAARAISEGLRDGRDPQIRIGRGYDHNFALDKGLTDRPGLAARLEDPASGRVLEVLTTEPGLQVYTGNYLDGTIVGKAGRLYRMGDGVALEPQKFPDAPNHPGFVSARVDPGQPYRHVMIYRLSVTR